MSAGYRTEALFPQRLYSGWSYVAFRSRRLPNGVSDKDMKLGPSRSAGIPSPMARFGGLRVPVPIKFRLLEPGT